MGQTKPLMHQVVANLLPQTLRREIPYPGSLPAGLELWHTYLLDSGHVIVAVPSDLYDAKTDLYQCLIPAPVKAVLRNYEIKAATINGNFMSVVVADLPYDANLGLMTRAEDEKP